jgi:hypothetical protein
LYSSVSDAVIYAQTPGEIIDQLILPFLKAEIGISTLRLDDALRVGVSYAHAELKLCRLARYPAAYRFRGIDATAFGCGKKVKRPENPATHRKLRQVNIKQITVDPETHRAMEMNIDWSATCMPGHTRRPNPKGIVKSLSTFPFQLPTGLCRVRNREGSNVSGSSNRFGSLTSTL